VGRARRDGDVLGSSFPLFLMVCALLRVVRWRSSGAIFLVNNRLNVEVGHLHLYTCVVSHLSACALWLLFFR